MQDHKFNDMKMKFNFINCLIIENSISAEKLCTRSRFEKEAKTSSKMADMNNWYCMCFACSILYM